MGQRDGSARCLLVTVRSSTRRAPAYALPAVGDPSCPPCSTAPRHPRAAGERLDAHRPSRTMGKLGVDGPVAQWPLGCARRRGASKAGGVSVREDVQSSHTKRGVLCAEHLLQGTWHEWAVARLMARGRILDYAL
jgi:hypothetical protein